MIKKMFYALAAVAVIAFAACEKDEENPTGTSGNDPATIESRTYVGTVEVTGAMPFTDPDVEWAIEQEEDGSYTLFMNKTKFSDQMPFRMDMEVRGMENQGSDGMFAFETDSIIPYYNGEQQESRIMTDFKCEADDETISVVFVCMGLNVNYEGTKK